MQSRKQSSCQLLAQLDQAARGGFYCDEKDRRKHVIWALVGINALGILAMLGKQFIFPDDDQPQKNQREDSNEDQNA